MNQKTAKRLKRIAKSFAETKNIPVGKADNFLKHLWLSTPRDKRARL